MGGGTQIRVLLMDDEDCVRGAVGQMLSRLGYDVEAACDGSEAVAAFAKAHREGRPFAAAILDLSVRGGLGGIATLTALKQIDPQVRAAVSTGYISDETGGDLRSQGFSAVLLKPYSLEELASVTARLAGRP
jgi:CheY-like chemotaxis protein